MHILISELQIEKRISELANLINENYEHDYPILLCVLKGAIFFYSDIVKQLIIPCNLDFVKISSYNGKERRDIKFDQKWTLDVKNRNIIIFEDIYDSGETLSFLKNELFKEGAKTVEICCLLNKNVTKKHELLIKYPGFEIDNLFVVGYGLDHNENLRNLNFIGVI